jgi:hypothetical protein
MTKNPNDEESEHGTHEPNLERSFQQLRPEIPARTPVDSREQIESEQKNVDQQTSHRQSSAPALARNQLLADLAYAGHPEELAANYDHEHDRHENKIEGPLAPIGHKPENKKNQPTEEEEKDQLVSSDEMSDDAHFKLRALIRRP